MDFTRVVLGRRPRQTLIRAAVLVAVSFVTFGYLLLPVRGEGISMAPTFRGGQLGLVNTLAYVWSRPQRGDIVAIRMAGPRVLYIKRIVALPTDRISIAGGVVLINGSALAEPYALGGAGWQLPEVTLGADQYFVIGDNRRMAIQNHDLGATTRARIVGEVLF